MTARCHLRSTFMPLSTSSILSRSKTPIGSGGKEIAAGIFLIAFLQFCALPTVCLGRAHQTVQKRPPKPVRQYDLATERTVLRRHTRKHGKKFKEAPPLARPSMPPSVDPTQDTTAFPSEYFSYVYFPSMSPEQRAGSASPSHAENLSPAPSLSKSRVPTFSNSNAEEPLYESDATTSIPSQSSSNSLSAASVGPLGDGSSGMPLTKPTLLPVNIISSSSSPSISSDTGPSLGGSTSTIPSTQPSPLQSSAPSLPNGSPLETAMPSTSPIIAATAPSLTSYSFTAPSESPSLLVMIPSSSPAESLLQPLPDMIVTIYLADALRFRRLATIPLENKDLLVRLISNFLDDMLPSILERNNNTFFSDNFMSVSITAKNVTLINSKYDNGERRNAVVASVAGIARFEIMPLPLLNVMTEALLHAFNCKECKGRFIQSLIGSMDKTLERATDVEVALATTGGKGELESTHGDGPDGPSLNNEGTNVNAVSKSAHEDSAPRKRSVVVGVSTSVVGFVALILLYGRFTGKDIVKEDGSTGNPEKTGRRSTRPIANNGGSVVSMQSLAAGSHQLSFSPDGTVPDEEKYGTRHTRTSSKKLNLFGRGGLQRSTSIPPSAYADLSTIKEDPSVEESQSMHRLSDASSADVSTLSAVHSIVHRVCISTGDPLPSQPPLMDSPLDLTADAATQSPFAHQKDSRVVPPALVAEGKEVRSKALSCLGDPVKHTTDESASCSDNSSCRVKSDSVDNESYSIPDRSVSDVDLSQTTSVTPDTMTSETNATASLVYEQFAGKVPASISYYSEDTGSSAKQFIDDLEWLERKIKEAEDFTSPAPATPVALGLSDSRSYEVDPFSPNYSSDADSATAERSPLKEISCQDCLAPPGELYIKLQSTKDGPAVESVDNDSPMEGKLFPDDLIIALDEVDTRSLTAASLGKILCKNMGFYRRFTVLRYSDSN